MRHRFHSMCPYFAMFPETFVRKHLAIAVKGSVILDPFCGRGTTVFESLLLGHSAIGLDLNPLAVCVSRAKARPPKRFAIHQRIDELEATYDPAGFTLPEGEFFNLCFTRATLAQIIYLREKLAWRTDDVDCFVAAMAAGCLHGESHRSARVFSNRMPRTISTKPAYSVRWWIKNGCLPPERNVFEILRAEADFRFESVAPDAVGEIVEGDARNASRLLAPWTGKVDQVITSPPYLDVTHFREDQWLRVWFLGGDPLPSTAAESDDRHSNEATGISCPRRGRGLPHY